MNVNISVLFGDEYISFILLTIRAVQGMHHKKRAEVSCYSDSV